MEYIYNQYMPKWCIWLSYILSGTTNNTYTQQQNNNRLKLIMVTNLKTIPSTYICTELSILTNVIDMWINLWRGKRL